MNENLVRLSIDQSTSTSFYVKIKNPDISWSNGAITFFDIRSANNVNCGSDLYIARSSVAINCVTTSTSEVVLHFSLVNQNASKSPSDYFGFTKETNYITEFTKEISMQGNLYLFTFLVDVTFKQAPIEVIDKRIQTVILDQFHQKALISYDFDTNVDVFEKQILVGASNLVNIPTRFSYDIPSAALTLIGTRQKLPISIIAQSMTKSVNSYSIKFVVISDMPSSRKFVSMNTTIPLKMSIRGYSHNFNIPVVLNG
jgi:hypothetical protein